LVKCAWLELTVAFRQSAHRSRSDKPGSRLSLLEWFLQCWQSDSGWSRQRRQSVCKRSEQ